MQKINRAMAAPGISVQRSPRGANALQDLQSGLHDKLRGKLNLFQATMLRWRELHPYIAVHVVRLNQPLEAARLKRRIDYRLETAGLTGLILDRGRRRFEFSGGPAAIEPTILAAGDDANRVVEREINERYGLFETPVRLRLRDSRVVGVEMPGEPQIVREVEDYLAQHPNSNRAGEFAIGTNIGLTEIIGNFLQDEKFPGVHVAFGDPYGHETGADWTAPSHVDVLASHADVVVDGRKIMEAGRFLV